MKSNIDWGPKQLRMLGWLWIAVACIALFARNEVLMTGSIISANVFWVGRAIIEKIETLSREV